MEKKYIDARSRTDKEIAMLKALIMLLADELGYKIVDWPFAPRIERKGEND